MCGDCATAKYCSEQCQTLDWQARHKFDCIGTQKRTREALDTYQNLVAAGRYRDAAELAAAELPIDMILLQALSKTSTMLIDELLRQMSATTPIPLEYCTSPLMVQHLIEHYPGRANVYAFISHHRDRPDTVALEYLARVMDIRPFCIEASEEPPQRFRSNLEREFKVVDLTLQELRHLVFRGYMFSSYRSWREDILLHQVEDLFFRRKNEATFKFWYGETIEECLHGITYAHFVEPRPAESPQSFPLMLTDYSAVYAGSRRAKTDMKLFKTPASRIVRSKPQVLDYQNSKVMELRDGFIPVTRYGKGMSKGLYHMDDEPESNFCGTFYYWEPESTTFLFIRKALVAPNKYSALKILGDTPDASDVKTDKRLRKHSLLMTPLEFRVYTENGLYQDRQPFGRIQFPDYVTLDRRHYTAHLLHIYAKEDELDQPLCHTAQSKGYDAVILTHMAGSRQVVCEVLDTRPRATSFANLHFYEP